MLFPGKQTQTVATAAATRWSSGEGVATPTLHRKAHSDLNAANYMLPALFCASNLEEKGTQRDHSGFRMKPNMTNEAGMSFRMNEKMSTRSLFPFAGSAGWGPHPALPAKQGRTLPPERFA
jgi:hypothetical protein